MPLSIIVRLRHGRYDAGGQDRGRAEWPPHPARVFCALTASAAGGECPGLRWLEAQQAPEIWADPVSRVHHGSRSGYVVTNATAKKKEQASSMAWPGRQSRVTGRAFAVPATDSFALVWPDSDPPPAALAELRDLARLVPYVGRSTSLTEVQVSNIVPGPVPGQAVYRAAAPGYSGNAFQVRVPYPGYSDELDAAYRDGRRSWEAGREATYTTAERQEPGDRQPAEGVLRGPFGPLMVWALQRPGPRIDGELVPAVAAALRAAVMSRVEDPVPAQVSGHGAQGQPHVGFLPLPDVSHDHADGHVIGLALAVPRDLPGDDLARLLQGVLVDPMTCVRVRGGRTLALRYGADRATLQPERWSRPSREWVTATPLMIDGYMRHGRDEAREVARSLEIAGYPRPTEVIVSPSPLVPGAVWRPHPSALPAGRPHRRLVHARVTFSEPLEGPVLAGTMRYLGLGLFLPAPGARARAGRATAASRDGHRHSQTAHLEAAP